MLTFLYSLVLTLLPLDSNIVRIIYIENDHRVYLQRGESGRHTLPRAKAMLSAWLIYTEHLDEIYLFM